MPKQCMIYQVNMIIKKKMGTLFGEFVLGLSIKLNSLVSITIDLARLLVAIKCS